MSKPNGRTIAEQTGWDVVLHYEPRRDGLSRGRVLFCEHPKLPLWKAHPYRSTWALTGRLQGGELVTWRFGTLRRAIEAGNSMIADGLP
jgi:hypothetical protein